MTPDGRPETFDELFTIPPKYQLHPLHTRRARVIRWLLTSTGFWGCNGTRWLMKRCYTKDSFI